MAGKKPAEPSPESIARANRQRLAAEEGARAMADVEQQAVAVRRNMERLRALRSQGGRGGENSRRSPRHRAEEAQNGAFKIRQASEFCFGQWAARLRDQLAKAAVGTLI